MTEVADELQQQPRQRRNGDVLLACALFFGQCEQGSPFDVIPFRPAENVIDNPTAGVTDEPCNANKT